MRSVIWIMYDVLSTSTKKHKNKLFEHLARSRIHSKLKCEMLMLMLN
jgi:hypothetical protein